MKVTKHLSSKSCRYGLQRSSAMAGFSMIEVLVSIVVLSIGILGLVALESQSLTSSQRAYFRSQANILVYDLADKMRSNTGANYAVVGAAEHDGECNSSASSCTATAIAEKDMFDWQASVASLLPSGLGNVALVGSTYTVTVTWDDDRDGVVEADERSSMELEL